MTLLNSVLLGILQGLTEFLPVSSSGHLVLAQHFLGLQDSGDILFEVFMHFGTLIAVLVFFRRRIWALLKAPFSGNKTQEQPDLTHNRSLLLYLILATAATVLVFLIGGEFFAALYARPLVVAFMLIITGCVVFGSDLVKTDRVNAAQMGWPRSLLIGLMQGIAIIPGISRSGMTISTALFAGVKRREAAEFSFLLSIPAILGANLSHIKEFQQLRISQAGIYLAGCLAAGVAGYLVIALLMDLISKARLKYFAYYCWIVALISIISILGFSL
ncbi:MAG TPA: undecaprenyl-diphosphate phosphatase [Candidatus Syntrophosphaera sp.]|nr:undecaprenyl-diphosphate phosphatase [Candidatus Syntrophosphaera sp.]